MALHFVAGGLAAARRYTYGGLAWGTVAQLWTLLVLWLLWRSGAAVRWRAHLERKWCSRRGADLVVTALVALPVGAVVFLTALPFDLYLSLMRERLYGFGRMSTAAWGLEWCKTAAVELVIGALLVEAIYALLRRWQRRRASGWWLRLWVLLMAVVFVGVTLEPVAIAPLFDHFSPLRNPRILQLAARASIPAQRLFVVDESARSAHTNAYVTGLFFSRRIVVYDTMLNGQAPDEMEFVIGHEMGHYVLHHVAKGVAFTGLLLLVGLGIVDVAVMGRLSRASTARGVRRLEDVAGLPLLLLTLGVVWFFMAPIANTFSRHIEHQADAFGLRLTPAPCAAVSSFLDEEKTDLVYPDPPAWVVDWFYDHPSQRERIDFARQFCPKSKSALQ